MNVEDLWNLDRQLDTRLGHLKLYSNFHPKKDQLKKKDSIDESLEFNKTQITSSIHKLPKQVFIKSSYPELTKKQPLPTKPKKLHSNVSSSEVGLSKNVMVKNSDPHNSVLLNKKLHHLPDSRTHLLDDAYCDPKKDAISSLKGQNIVWNLKFSNTNKNCEQYLKKFQDNNLNSSLSVSDNIYLPIVVNKDYNVNGNTCSLGIGVDQCDKYTVKPKSIGKNSDEDLVQLNDMSCLNLQETNAEEKNKELEEEKSEELEGNKNEELEEEKSEELEGKKNEDLEREQNGVEDNLFDDFLEHSTRIRLKQLSVKVDDLTEALKLVQDERKKLAVEKKKALLRAQSAENNLKKTGKQLSVLQLQVTRQHEANKHLEARIKDFVVEKKLQQKELSLMRAEQCERASAKGTVEAQLTRARTELSTLREQLITLKVKFKSEMDKLKEDAAGSLQKIQMLERQECYQAILIKKQEKLLVNLNEQKNNIAAAKAAQCLEEKFIAMIAPLQHSSIN